MNNFLEFIQLDIESKKNLVSITPTKTKTNKKNYNQIIDTIEKKYKEYKISVKNYLLAKSRSFEIKSKESDNSKIGETLLELQRVEFLLNPMNTFFEKMGFDNLLYKISNYYTFNFTSLESIICDFLEKFKLADIKFDIEDFNYTCYVKEYMVSFLECYNNKSSNYDKAIEVFEKIYWVNPEIVEHIELNFRKLIKKNEKKFNNYIEKLKKDIMFENKIKNYSDCLDKIHDIYIELKVSNKESVFDIINLSKTGEIDINQCLETNKVRIETYNSLIGSALKNNDKLKDKRFYELEKLKSSVSEYKNYLQYLPLLNNFVKEYKDIIPDDVKKYDHKAIKEIVSNINNKEKELEKLNNKIFGSKLSIFKVKNESDLKELKNKSVIYAKELYQLYKTYNDEYFKDKILSILNKSLTVSDVLKIYYSFDYFKKSAIKKVFELESYDEIVKVSNSFDLFAIDPTNVISNGIMIFDNNDVAKIIANKYKKNNIGINEEDLSEDNLDSLLSRINLLIRINTIENSKTTVEKIWFMTKVENIIKNEKNNIKD